MSDGPGTEDGKASGEAEFVDVLYAGKRVGMRAHALYPRQSGVEHGPGVGWSTYCGRLWADGPRTNPSQWSHAPTCVTQRCRRCIQCLAKKR